MKRYQRVGEPTTDYKLEEKLYNISKDVNFIYKQAFETFIKDFKNNTLKNRDEYEDTKSTRSVGWGDYIFKELHTSQLKSDDCKKANESLSIPIICGVFKDGSFHSFQKDNNPYIQISLHQDIVNMLYRDGKDFNKKITGKSIQKRALNELSEGRIKSTIAHELSHWIDNANYDIFDKIVGKAQTPQERKELLKLKNENVDMTYFEIQGQIHGVSALKTVNKKIWDKITLEDLFEMYTPLANIAIKLHRNYREEVFTIWIKLLVLRLARENLLGDKMRLPFNITKLIESENKKSYKI